MTRNQTGVCHVSICRDENRDHLSSCQTTENGFALFSWWWTKIWPWRPHFSRRCLWDVGVIEIGCFNFYGVVFGKELLNERSQWSPKEWCSFSREGVAKILPRFTQAPHPSFVLPCRTHACLHSTEFTAVILSYFAERIHIGVSGDALLFVIYPQICTPGAQHVPAHSHCRLNMMPSRRGQTLGHAHGHVTKFTRQ